MMRRGQTPASTGSSASAASTDRILRRVQSLIEEGQGAGTFRRDLPQRWLITTAYSLMHAAAEDVTAGRLDADDAAGLVTATPLAAFTPQAGE